MKSKERYMCNGQPCRAYANQGLQQLNLVKFQQYDVFGLHFRLQAGGVCNISDFFLSFTFVRGLNQVLPGEIRHSTSGNRGQNFLCDGCEAHVSNRHQVRFAARITFGTQIPPLPQWPFARAVIITHQFLCHKSLASVSNMASDPTKRRGFSCVSLEFRSAPSYHCRLSCFTTLFVVVPH
jgi:hypothetical protein